MFKNFQKFKETFKKILKNLKNTYTILRNLTKFFIQFWFRLRKFKETFKKNFEIFEEMF